MRALIIALGLMLAVPASPLLAEEEAAETPVPARRIERGEVIREADLRLAAVETRQLRPDSLLDEGAIVGMEARRTLLPGRVISSLALRAPLMVEKNAQVSALYRDGTLELNLLALAQDDGMKGDTVRLTNPSTGNTVYAVVTGPSRARITH
ncbi:flagellar basal body P-ring biosynthesis protein FlgA [Tepidicaulis marinus]|uniref:Flagella basal body P-ring formation protein FlgA n=1 Tax=Tepidicaulis marinus TaxID=1333998 RepID=A0A081BB57_9HYPH|nr:flagellar basal body P-ring formation chaperone FlgA [Tepidicaulis marinus]GAK45275.1 flagellar basal body P-ring biosynthesis protein FlgA [Tepidicaulis marinus]